MQQLRQYWREIWLFLSLTAIILCFVFQAKNEVLFYCLFSLLLSIITLCGWWGNVLRYFFSFFNGQKGFWVTILSWGLGMQAMLHMGAYIFGENIILQEGGKFLFTLSLCMVIFSFGRIILKGVR